MSYTIAVEGAGPFTLGYMSQTQRDWWTNYPSQKQVNRSTYSSMFSGKVDGATDMVQWGLAHLDGTYNTGSVSFTLRKYTSGAIYRVEYKFYGQRDAGGANIGTSDFPISNSNYPTRTYVEYMLIYPDVNFTVSGTISAGSTDGGVTTDGDYYYITANIGPSSQWVSLARKHQNFPGPASTTGGGIGDFNLNSDSIDFPTLPTGGAVSSSFVSLYNPTNTELHEIASYMWSSDIGQAWEAIFKLISDPMDMVIGLNMYPFTIPASALSAQKVDVEAGIIDIKVDPLTNVQSYKLISQYIELDCGSIDVGQFYGSALDFQPYTKATIHVPFCGDYPLNIDDIRSRIDDTVGTTTLSLKYHVDLFSGACVAMLKVGDAVLYQWSGSMAMNVPMTGTDYSNTIQNVISTATTIGMAASGAGAGAAASKETGKEAAASASSAAMRADSTLGSLANASVGMAASLKPQIQRAGSVAGSAGFLGVQSPYIVFEIPRQSIAEDYAKFNGFPCNISFKLLDLVGDGFTVVSNMHLEDITTNTAGILSGATDKELGEIEQLLGGGVIL